MGGTPVFAGSRVPVQTLLDYLEAGDSIDDFLAGFPSAYSGPCRASIPEQAGPGFRSMPGHRSGACRAGVSEAG